MSRGTNPEIREARNQDEGLFFSGSLVRRASGVCGIGTESDSVIVSGIEVIGENIAQTLIFGSSPVPGALPDDPIDGVSVPNTRDSGSAL